MKTPMCPKCKGKLYPERDLSGKAVSVGYLICGARWFRGVTRRGPTTLERQRVNMKAMPGGKRA